MANVKRVELTGSEVCVSGLGGQNVAVKNLGAGTIYVSTLPNITADADNVVEIPAGGGEVILDAHGAVYILGTGRAQCTGTDYATPNFKLPSSSESGGGGGTGDVSKAYVDAQDSTNLGAAKAYTNMEITAVKEDVSGNADSITALQTDMTAAQTAIAANTEAITAADGKADEAQAAADTANSVAAENATAITALQNEKADKSAVSKEIADKLAEIVANAPEDFDTLKEISDWIEGHGDSAAAMNSQIAANTADITALETSKADKSEIPTTLPANGGNADTVNGHTVNADVPENANFTDTIYTLPKSTKTVLGGVKIGDGLSMADDGTLSMINPFVAIHVNESDADLNDYKIGGLYFFTTQTTVNNKPNDGGVGWLMVIGENLTHQVKQLWFKFGTNSWYTFVRTYTNSSKTWTAWGRFAVGSSESTSSLTNTMFATSADDGNAASEIYTQLAELDAQSVRPLRAVAAGTATDEDKAKLVEIEEQAETLRAELAALGGE